MDSEFWAEATAEAFDMLLQVVQEEYGEVTKPEWWNDESPKALSKSARVVRAGRRRTMSQHTTCAALYRPCLRLSLFSRPLFSPYAVPRTALGFTRACRTYFKAVGPVSTPPAGERYNIQCPTHSFNTSGAYFETVVWPYYGQRGHCGSVCHSGLRLTRACACSVSSRVHSGLPRRRGPP